MIVGGSGPWRCWCASYARPAGACGGFFCNRPPPDGTLPIAQAAENVLFVLDRDPATGAGTVEAHIQILYTGPASEFSWIVPVTAVPTVTVGADILFDRIEPPTRPSFNVSYQMEGNCRGVSGVGAGCGSAAAGGGDSAGVGTVADAGIGGVDVLAQGSAGPYEYVVIRSEDGATLRTWLTDQQLLRVAGERARSSTSTSPGSSRSSRFGSSAARTPRRSARSCCAWPPSRLACRSS